MHDATPETEYAKERYSAGHRAKFWARIDASGDCWLWTGTKNAYGYPVLSVGVLPTGSAKVAQAHRMAWEMLVGEIPTGYQVDHRCFTPLCVNPDHLEPVTHQENLARCRWHHNRKKTHCPQGHPFSEENTYIIPSTGSRRCLICMKAQDRARYVAKKMAVSNL